MHLSSQTGKDGSVNIEIFRNSGQLVLLQTNNGEVPMLGYVFLKTKTQQDDVVTALRSFTTSDTLLEASSGTVEFSPRSTALALIMMTPLRPNSTMGKKQFANIAMSHPSFNVLVRSIQDALILDPQSVLSNDLHPEIFELAVRISLDTFQELSRRLNLSTSFSGLGADQPSENVVSSSGFIDRPDDRPYVDSYPKPHVNLVNPTVGYYAVGPYDWDAWDEDREYKLRDIDGDGNGEIIILKPRQWQWLKLTWPPSLSGLEDPTEERDYKLETNFETNRVLFYIDYGYRFTERAGPKGEIALIGGVYNSIDMVIKLLEMITQLPISICIDLFTGVGSLNEILQFYVEEINDYFPPTKLVSLLENQSLSELVGKWLDLNKEITKWLTNPHGYFTEQCAERVLGGIKEPQDLADLLDPDILKEFLNATGKVSKGLMKSIDKLSSILGVVPQIAWIIGTYNIISNPENREVEYGVTRAERPEWRITYIPNAHLLQPSENLVIGQVPFEVDFEINAADELGRLRKLRADFDGDRTWDLEASPKDCFESEVIQICSWLLNHIYESNGTFEAMFEVTDDDGATDIETIQIIVTGAPPNTPPQASFTFSPTNPQVGQSVTFNPQGSSDNQDSDSQLQARWDFDSDGTWDIDFADGKTAVDIVTHVYPTTGTFTAKLEIKDTGGLTDTHTKTINVSDELPVAPSNLVADAVSSSQIDLSWQDNSDNEAGFKIERKTGSAGTYSQIDTVAADVTSYSDLTVSPNTTYFYRVRAFNSAGNSGYSNEDSATTPGTPGNPPAAPSNLRLTVNTSSRITLNWDDNSDDEDGFKIERKTGAGGTFSQIATVEANKTGYTDKNLNASTTYCYRVRAFNSAGNSGYSNEECATTLDRCTG